MEPKAPENSEGTNDNSSITSFGRQSQKSGSKTTTSVFRERTRAADREADLAKLKVKHLKEKIAAKKAQLEIQEAEHEADRKEIEALLLKEELDKYNLSDRMRDFEDNSVGEDNVKIETTPQVKQEDFPINDIKSSCL